MIILRLFMAVLCLNAYSSEEASIYITALKKEGINDKILESPIFEKCKKQVDSIEALNDAESKEKVRGCIVEAVSKADDTALEDLSENLKINTVDFQETKNAKSIREYLNKRIYEAIHGEDYENKRLKELKHIDHGLFLRLYKSQVSKNLILDVSRYCLENIGISGNPGSYVMGAAPLGKVKEGEKDSSFVSSLKAMSKGEEGAGIGLVSKTIFKEDAENKRFVISDEASSAGSKTFEGDLGVSGFWSSIQEYRYCPQLRTNDRNDPCYYKNARDQKMIKALKEDELNQGQTNPDQLGGKYAFCSTFLIRNMCEIYRCNNVYDWSDPEKDNIKYCSSVLGQSRPIQINQSDASKASLEVSNHYKKKGQLACNLISKIEDYKKTLMAIEQSENQQGEFKGHAGISAGEAGFKAGEYTGRGENGSKSINEITSISSKELVESAKALGQNEEEAKRLRDECFESGLLITNKEECQALAGPMDEQDFAKVQLDTEAQTQAYLERVRKLKEQPDEEKLEALLLKHGLHDYVGKLDEFPVEDLVQLIEDKYKTERMALINNMKDRFYSMTKKKKEEDENAITSVASDQINEIEQHKERLETLLSYSNIVSSYLQVEDEQGNKFKNSSARMIEREGFDAHAGVEGAKERENYEVYFADTEESEGSQGDLSAGQLIDGILGIGEAQ